MQSPKDCKVSAFALLILIALALEIQPMWCVPPRPVPATEHVRVWVFLKSKVYHCPKSRWYGKGSDGKYMDECDALREGYKPAFGVSCGSDCSE